MLSDEVSNSRTINEKIKVDEVVSEVMSEIKKEDGSQNNSSDYNEERNPEHLEDNDRKKIEVIK